MGKYNIRCNAIAPGLVLTPAALNNLPEETRKIFARHNALPYLGQPQDIASVVAFLASEDAQIPHRPNPRSRRRPDHSQSYCCRFHLTLTPITYETPYPQPAHFLS